MVDKTALVDSNGLSTQKKYALNGFGHMPRAIVRLPSFKTENFVLLIWFCAIIFEQFEFVVTMHL